MSYYTKKTYNNLPYKKPKTISFDEPNSEEEFTDTEEFIEDECEDEQFNTINNKLTDLSKQLDNILELVKELKKL